MPVVLSAVDLLRRIIQLVAPSPSLLSTRAQAQGSLTAVLSVLSVRKEEFTLAYKPKAVHGIHVSNLTFCYDVSEANALSRPVLQNVSLFIATGSKVGVMGRSQAGKSTFLGLLSRLLQPSDGVVAVDGIPINEVGSDFVFVRFTGSTMLADGK